jgi:hypothetical protein
MLRSISDRKGTTGVLFRTPTQAGVAPSDYYFWLDAGDATNGATSWVSKEGKSFVSTTITKTASAINGHPAITSNFHHWTAGADFNLTAGHTVFVVGQFTTVAQYNRMVSCAALNTADYSTTGGVVPLILSGVPSGDTVQWGTMKPGGAYQSTLNLRRGIPGLWASWRDGASVTNQGWGGLNAATGSTTSMGTAPTANFRRIAVGGDPYSGGDWTGLVCEVIFYNRYLNATEFGVVRDALRTKYAL